MEFLDSLNSASDGFKAAVMTLNSDLKYTEEMTKKFMLLPLHAMLSDEDVVYICKKINEFYDSKNN